MTALKQLCCLLLLALLTSCGRRTPVDDSKLIQDNKVRPKKITEPTSVLTNATNRVQ